MVNVKCTGNYYLDLQQLLFTQPQLKQKIDNAVILFLKNPDDTRVLNHVLKDRIEDKWAFSITNDVRIVYEWMGKNTVRFLAIGGHNKVYKKIAKRELTS